MLVLEGSAEDLVLPVRSLAEDGRVGVVGTCRVLAEGRHIIVVFGEFPQVHHIDAAGLAGNREHTVVGELGFARLAALRGDENHTIGALGAVDGGGGGILEDFHTEDVVRVYGGERRDGGNLAVAEAPEAEVAAGVAAALHDYAVDYVERLGVSVYGSLSADADGGGGTRSSGSLHGGYTGRAALE